MEFLNLRESTKLSYGTADDVKSTPSHHVIFQVTTSKDSLEPMDLDEEKDEIVTRKRRETD